MEPAEGADLVVVALGFDPVPCPHLGDFADLAVNDWGGLVVDGNQMTSLPGVFAAGDVRQGSVKRVASAVGEGAATIPQIHHYLQTTPATPAAVSR